MLYRLLFLLLPGLFLATCQPTNQQGREHLKGLMADYGLDTAKFAVFIRSFKAEQELELWVKTEQSTAFSLLKTYPVCQSSGDLGPKRKEGDRQVPEGFYHVDRLNPHSNFHLSLGLNYPNESDRIRGDREQPGSDIFIHGACVTVGCIPLTDPLIEEVYTLVETAKVRGQQRVEVHIFPGRMHTASFQELMKNSPHRTFWEELLPGYKYFEEHRRPAAFTIDDQGRYLLPEE